MPEQTASRLRTKDLTLIALFTVLTAVCAWISVPVPAPLIQFTMQTFAVFAALLTLGGRRGTYAVTAYLLLGAVGAPVFSNFRGGFRYPVHNQAANLSILSGNPGQCPQKQCFCFTAALEKADTPAEALDGLVNLP